MPRLRRSSLLVIAVALCATILAACGSDSGSSAKDDAAKVLQDTFSGAKSIKSGQLSLTIATKPVSGQGSSVALTGPFQSNGTAKVPSFDLTLALTGQGQTFTVGATSTGTAGYLTLAGTSYVLDDKTFDGFAKGYTSSQKSTSTAPKNETTLAKLGIDPRRWLSSPKIAGTTATGGTDTIHVVAGIAVPALLADLNRLLGRASGAAVPSTGAKVPKKLTAAQLAEAQKAITGVKVDVFTGKDDKTLRRMVIAFDLKMDTGKTLYGFGSGRVSLDLTISDLNQPQTIDAPKDAKPFTELQKQLESVVGSITEGAKKGSGGSSGSSGADSGTSSGDASPSASSKYLTCLQKAGQDLAEVQKCASLVGQ